MAASPSVSASWDSVSELDVMMELISLSLDTADSDVRSPLLANC